MVLSGFAGTVHIVQTSGQKKGQAMNEGMNETKKMSILC
jgi:hypothetical protein